MDISVFSVTGPVMIGPSSSHTAGACRLARVAREIIISPFNHVSFGLHGSFAKTYKGHGTNRALLAGVMGYKEDDEAIARAFELAESAGFTYDFHEVELEDVHENTVLLDFTMADGRHNEIIGSSLGGGRIVITRTNGFETEYTAQTPTLIIRQQDKPGVISQVTGILAQKGINIGVMKVSRRGKGDTAFCVIETDSEIREDVVESLTRIEDLLFVRALNIWG